MQVLKLVIWGFILMSYIFGSIFTLGIEAGLREKRSGIVHWIIMLAIWLFSPVLVVLFFIDIFKKNS